MVQDQLTPSEPIGGRYSIEREIGAGGMATVYLARDDRHHRRVAVKLLRRELAAVVGTERFLAEIAVTATLQHPHVVPLFDSGELPNAGEAGSGLPFYVMPYIEGETLRARLVRERQLPVDDAVRIARAVARALEYAHEHGVIHRDLKPENILLQHGEPVVTDFGISLALANAASERMTQSGIFLGTPEYMSPEQAAGDRNIDGRSDIYALGAVLYEMLAGEPPHTGPTAQAIIARVVADAPAPLESRRPAVPPAVSLAVARALAKVPADRFSSAAAFADALDSPIGATAALSSHLPKARRSLLPALALAAGVALGAASFAMLRPGAPSEPLRRLALLPPPGLSFEGFALSPDGRRVAFAASDSTGPSRLWVRSLDSTDATLIVDSDGASDPFWSPDGRSVGFFAGDKLKRVEVAGGAPQTLCTFDFNRGGSRGATWGINDTILFAAWEFHPSPLHAVSAHGGEPRIVDTREPASSEGHHWWPAFLPDGRHFLYYVVNARTDLTGIYIGSLDGSPGRLLLRAPTAGIPVSISTSGDDAAVLYVEAGTLKSRRLSVASAALSADATSLATGVVPDAQAHHALVTASRSGELVYASRLGRTRLHWLDRRGAELGAVGEAGLHIDLKIAPDDQRALVQREDARGKADLHVIVDRASDTRLTEGDEYHGSPTWTPDGEYAVYFVIPKGHRWEIRQRAVAGAGTEALVHRADNDIVPLDWSPDGKTLMYVALTSGDNQSDLWAWSRENGGSTKPFLATAADENFARFSQDGHWVAFQSNRSGEYEIYVAPFPAGNATPIRVSRGGGTQPRWPRRGHEIVYLGSDKRLMSVEVSTAGGFRASTPTPLFPIRPSGVLSYDVTSDGKRFLVARPEDEATSRPATVLLNWTSMLARR